MARVIMLEQFLPYDFFQGDATTGGVSLYFETHIHIFLMYLVCRICNKQLRPKLRPYVFGQQKLISVKKVPDTTM